MSKVLELGPEAEECIFVTVFVEDSRCISETTLEKHLTNSHKMPARTKSSFKYFIPRWNRGNYESFGYPAVHEALTWNLATNYCRNTGDVLKYKKSQSQEYAGDQQPHFLPLALNPGMAKTPTEPLLSTYEIPELKAGSFENQWLHDRRLEVIGRRD